MHVLELTQQLMKIPSVTDSQKELAPLEYIKNLLEKEHITYKIIGSGNKQNLVAQIGKGGKSVLLNGHFDVVPADEDMFVPKVADGMLSGRGSADAKGPLAAMLTAFIALSKQPLNGKVILCCVCDEENAGVKGTEVLVQKGIVGDYNIIGEPTDNDIIIAEKGFLRLNIHIVGKETHAAFPLPKLNAISIAARIIQELEDIKFDGKHPLLSKTTLSFGLITGGRKINIGAGSCDIGIDIRYLPGQKEADIISKVKKLCEYIHPVEISIIPSGIPFEITPDSLLVKAAQEVSGGRAKGVDFATDARFYGNNSAIVIGPGKSELAHQAIEYVAVEDIEKAAQYYEALVKKCLES